MSSPVTTPATGIAPAATSAAPAPRAIIDYDFDSSRYRDARYGSIFQVLTAHP